MWGDAYFLHLKTPKLVNVLHQIGLSLVREWKQREREREDLLSDAVLSHVVAVREREGEGESLVSSTKLKVDSR